MGLFSSTQRPVPTAAGCVVRHSALGTEALYEVLAESQGGVIVTVEVLSAPGLAAGTHVRLMRDAVASMETLERPLAPIAA